MHSSHADSLRRFAALQGEQREEALRTHVLDEETRSTIRQAVEAQQHFLLGRVLSDSVSDLHSWNTSLRVSC